MKQKNIVLMVVAVGCGLVAAFLTTQINAKPKIETVEVLVAKKNLTVGTILAKADLPNLVERRKIPKEALPPQFVVNEEDLVDKRLSRSTNKDEVINPQFLSKGGVITLPDGKDMASFSVTAVDSAGGFVGPGSKVDVLARIDLVGTIEVFPLLIDMQVLAVNTATSYEQKATFADVSMVSLAVTQEEALLLELAKQRNCHLSLLLRHEGKPLDPSYDMKKIKKMLETDKSKTKFETTASKDPREDPPPGWVPPTAVTPVTPVAKPEMVKVLIANADIAPNTDITADLLKEKFHEKEFNKEVVEGACLDLNNYLGKAFKYGVAKGQWVTDAMVGAPALKGPPPDAHVDNEPKPAPKPDPTLVGPVAPVTPPTTTTTPPKVTPTVPVVAKRIRDVSVHTASGTMIHRYVEVRPDEWKLMAVLSPEEAARAAAAAEKAALEKEKASSPERDSATTPGAKQFE
jgi:pilus assembly protein CpaB